MVHHDDRTGFPACQPARAGGYPSSASAVAEAVAVHRHGQCANRRDEHCAELSERGQSVAVGPGCFVDVTDRGDDGRAAVVSGSRFVEGFGWSECAVAELYAADGATQALGSGESGGHLGGVASARRWQCTGKVDLWADQSVLSLECAAASRSRGAVIWSGLDARQRLGGVASRRRFAAGQGGGSNSI